MGSAGTTHWSRLERWSPTLFLLAGGVLVFYVAWNGLFAFTEMVPEKNGLEIGYVLGFLGLLGLYPRLADRQPWLVRIGALAAGCGIVALTFISVNDILIITGLTAGNLPGWSIVRFLPLFGFIGGYLCFGVASFLSGNYPRRVSLLLLVPGLIVVVMLVHIAAGYASARTAFVISAGEALAHVAIGATLRTKSAEDSRDADELEATRETSGDSGIESSTDD